MKPAPSQTSRHVVTLRVRAPGAGLLALVAAIAFALGAAWERSIPIDEGVRGVVECGTVDGGGADGR